MPTDEQLIAAARAAVETAAGVCRHVQRNLDVVRAITKDDDSPVTIGDFAAQAVAAHVLREHLGSFVLVGEESSAFLRVPEHKDHLGATLEVARMAWDGIDEEQLLETIDLGTQEPMADGFWTLDPIDGTKGFLRGQQYAVALAYIRNGEPAIAAMATPNLSPDQSAPVDRTDPHGTVYLAELGSGAVECSEQGSRPLRDRADDKASGVRVCGSVERAHSSEPDTLRVLSHLADDPEIGVGERVRIDSQAKYAVTARGQADAYLRLPKGAGYVERIWDHAAGALIAGEAGCMVSDVRGAPLDFGQGRGLERNAGIVCAPPTVYSALMRAMSLAGIAS